MDLERRKDLWLIAAVGLTLCLEVLWLLHQTRVLRIPGLSRTRSGSSRAIGQVLERTKDLKNRRPRSLTWYPAAPGDAIHLQDTLLTGPFSTARIQVEGAGEILLEPNTLLRFSGDQTGWRSAPLALELAQGRARVRSAQSEIKVRVRDREFELAKAAEVVVTSEPLAASTRVEVKVGEIHVPGLSAPGQTPQGSSDAPVSIPAGEVLEVGEARELSRVVRELKFEPVAPRPGEVIELLADKADKGIDLRWTGDSDVVLEIARDESFSEPKRLEPSGNEARVKLAWGRHYWRARRGEQLAETVGFELRPRVQYRLVAPGEGRSFKGDDPLFFRWSSEGDASRFRLVVSRDRAGRDVVVQREVEGSEVQLGSLPAGRYYWRVQADHPAVGLLPSSEPISFRVRGPLAPPKPKGVKVLPKRSERDRDMNWLEWLGEWWMPSAIAADKTLRLEFEWAKVRGAKGYRFEVARDKEFGSPIARLEVEETAVEVELPIAEQYYWRVTALDENGELGKPSAPEVVRPGVLAAESERPPPAPSKPVPSVAGAGGGALSGSGGGPGRGPASIHEWDVSPRSLELRAGTGGVLRNQKLAEGATGFSSSGLPLGMWAAEMTLENEWGRFRLGGWYQSLKLTTDNSELSGIQPDLKGTTFGFRAMRLFRRSLFGADLWAGLSTERGLRVIRTGSTLSEARAVWDLAAVAGPIFSSRLGRNWFVEGEALIEVAPFGQSRGGGIVAAGRFSHRNLRLAFAGGSLFPALELSTHARLRWIAPASTRAFEWGFGATLLATAAF